MANLYNRLLGWLFGRQGATKDGASHDHPTGPSNDIANEYAHGVVPFDENLLERSRTQWQFGDWASLIKLERDTLQHHPDRAKLALLVAAGHLQHANSEAARQFTRLAQDWGCSKKLVSQILISGVYNSLGRAAKGAGHHARSQQHFKQAISIGAVGVDVGLFAQARLESQIRQQEQVRFKLVNRSDQYPKNSEQLSIVESIDSAPAVPEKFCLSPRYKSRQEYWHYDDMLAEDHWQLEVYLQTYAIMRKNNFSRIADIGCGSAFKLMTYLREYETIGYELPVNVEILRKKYPDRKWKVSDFQSDELIDVDVIVCSDVIEHLVNPDELLQFVRQQKFKYLVLSTPERDLVYSKSDSASLGPPKNPAHLREWNFPEFEKYIGMHFKICKHLVTNAEQATQMIVCTHY